MGEDEQNDDYQAVEPVEPETALARIDRILIDTYGVESAVTVAEKTGLDPGEIAKRRQELFSAIDILDIQARQAKLMLQLEAMVVEVRNRLNTSSDRNLAGLVNSAAGAIGRTLKALADLEKASKVDVETINARRAATSVEIIEKAYHRQLGRLEERYGVAADDLEDEFLEITKDIAREYDAIANAR